LEGGRGWLFKTKSNKARNEKEKTNLSLQILQEEDASHKRQKIVRQLLPDDGENDSPDALQGMSDGPNDISRACWNKEHGNCAEDCNCACHKKA
jgi:hypothetical protein